jgi:DNA repair protein RecO (recombination protein O)
MPGSFKTEAIVLRSIRYGEADRILHLYSRERGRIGAVAKGVRRPKSRFGGRLEPLFRVNLVLHEGRGELYTVTSVQTVHAHAALREGRAALTALRPRVETVGVGAASARYPHPAFGPLNLYEWLAFVALHEERHRRQIERVLGAAG